MTRLVRPDVTWKDSWAATVAEFEGGHIDGSGLGDLPDLDTTESGCRRAVEHLLAQADPATPLPDDRVPCTFFWIVADSADAPEGSDSDQAEEVVGHLALRHELNDWLHEFGGHIGYSVRPSRRREGHAGRALTLALREARELGLERVLVTCDEDNEGSRRTIEGNGGVLEDIRGAKRRYWIDTGA
ncbi:GNAT family N-acetyltransferase [Nocardioides sp. dk4132]|uniref:GNAT family N-acetyltransferase n=1 Tax=unclassified Nocardioides TaxID=2615069 RepID=UPI001294E23E|nr:MULTISPECIES: GNAT family N-acetyltransferase [unclassified Nocardioides]MQW77927.1 GNAT family N-acetyltransferase [Nocardioides sp. dk4132]QGA09149.1 GNAT family N-acetyltransferase [Nocardioides sp. dk884]